MEGPYLRFKFQTEDTKNLLDIYQFIKDQVNSKYVGKCFKGQLITGVEELPEEEFIVRNKLELGHCFMQVQGKFKPSIFKLAAGSILVNCIVVEIKNKAQTAILEFTGDTHQHKFRCKIMAPITESLINNITTVGIKTNVQVRGVYYYPFIDSINVDGVIVAEPVLGIFSTFDVATIDQADWKLFTEFQEVIAGFTPEQKQELRMRAKTIFVDVETYYLPIKDSKKVSLKYKDGGISGAKGTVIETGLHKSQVVYVDMLDPESLTLYVVRDWTADLSVAGLGAHVADKDPTIGTKEVLMYYTQWLNSLINLVYISHNT
jgi:hypothetical protein